MFSIEINYFQGNTIQANNLNALCRDQSKKKYSFKLRNR